MVKHKYILSLVAAALLAASPLSFAAPFGTFGTFGTFGGANPGVGPAPFTGAFNPSPGFFGNRSGMFGSAPGTGTSIIGSPGPGSSWIGSVGSTIPGSSVIGSVGSTLPGSSSIGSVGSMPGFDSNGFSAITPGTIGAFPVGPCTPPGSFSSPC